VRGMTSLLFGPANRPLFALRLYGLDTWMCAVRCNPRFMHTNELQKSNWVYRQLACTVDGKCRRRVALMILSFLSDIVQPLQGPAEGNEMKLRCSIYLLCSPEAENILPMQEGVSALVREVNSVCITISCCPATAARRHAGKWMALFRARFFRPFSDGCIISQPSHLRALWPVCCPSHNLFALLLALLRPTPCL
jgi:hypothetical protein